MSFQGGASYSVVRVTGDFVFIVDNCAPARSSVTNDAARVVLEVLKRYGSARRIVYRDSCGDWDELVHGGGVFVCFKPARELARRELGLLEAP